MSANSFASQDGKFTVQVRDYETSKIVGLLEISGLKPIAKLNLELLDGWNWEDFPKNL
jgi:hypothetical protein